MARRDLHSGDNSDLVIDTNAGDFIIRDSDTAHIDNIVGTNAGEWKQYPLLGVGIINLLNGSAGLETARRLITTQLEEDGYEVEDIPLENGFLDVQATLRESEI